MPYSKSRETHGKAEGLGHDDEKERQHKRFASISEDGSVSRQKLLDTMRRNGILEDDPRMKPVLKTMNQKFYGVEQYDEAQFEEIIQPASVLIHDLLSSQLTIPDFEGFCKELVELFKLTEPNTGGENAQYIPELADVDPDQFGISICTVDGQRFGFGDFKEPFCIQSCVKPLTYTMASDEQGSNKVHNHIGREPSGGVFNKLALKEFTEDRSVPHNPMINAGAIMSCALIKPGAAQADKFRHVNEVMERLCGNTRLGFSNSTYLSERATADRNFCLGYMMHEYKAFPEHTDLVSVLEFYFQCCSLQVTCDQMAILAGTMANGGQCPTTGDRVFRPGNVKNCLSLMLSCGLYDYSGEWAFSIGLPGKSGVGGCVWLVIPKVMGIAIWSPRLDKIGNSVRGVEFATRLVEKYNFHVYDHLLAVKKIDPTEGKKEGSQRNLLALLFAAAEGDLSQIKRLYVQGVDMYQGDYDARTALHLAASEGHTDIVEFLSKSRGKYVHVDKLSSRDRWNNTPLDDAYANGHQSVITLLEEAGAQRALGLPRTASQAEIDARIAESTPRRGLVRMVTKFQGKGEALNGAEADNATVQV